LSRGLKPVVVPIRASKVPAARTGTAPWSSPHEVRRVKDEDRPTQSDV